jgi:hypothetical protein
MALFRTEVRNCIFGIILQKKGKGRGRRKKAAKQRKKKKKLRDKKEEQEREAKRRERIQCRSVLTRTSSNRLIRQD